MVRRGGSEGDREGDGGDLSAQAEFAKYCWEQELKWTKRRLMWSNFGGAWSIAWATADFWWAYHGSATEQILYGLIGVLMAAFAVWDIKQSVVANQKLDAMRGVEQQWEENGNRPW